MALIHYKESTGSPEKSAERATFSSVGVWDIGAGVGSLIRGFAGI